MHQMSLFAPENLPEIKSGDDLGSIFINHLNRERFILNDGDILVIAHKIVSKAEGRFILLKNIVPSDRAKETANLTGKDSRLIELILEESEEVLKVRQGLIITRHRLGFVCANAAIDQSNTGEKDGVILLPKDPDKSAREIRKTIKQKLGINVAVIINDSHGRPFREGAVGVAVGIAGINPMLSYIGKMDRNGYVMRSSVEAIADEMASAATLLMGQGSESRPVVIIRGFQYKAGNEGIKTLIRPTKYDLFS